jgi:hypothetical protein
MTKKEEKKAEVEQRKRVAELMNKLWKYRPNIKVEERMACDDVYLDVLDLAIKSKEYNQKK